MDNRSLAETLLCELMAQAVGVPEIGADADFLASASTARRASVTSSNRVGWRTQRGQDVGGVGGLAHESRLLQPRVPDLAVLNQPGDAAGPT
ncbi:hypothetical protein ACFVHS_44135 [Streptomyces sp. NPDC057746]|uniref:hypothetical protein n=1 Tax=Streptomyces sp. NPDC057746 TaxID=3346237 RepID=UPI003679F76E